MIIPNEAWLFLVLVSVYLLGYSMGYNAGVASGKVEALEDTYGAIEPGEDDD